MKNIAVKHPVSRLDKISDIKHCCSYMVSAGKGRQMKCQHIKFSIFVLLLSAVAWGQLRGRDTDGDIHNGECVDDDAFADERYRTYVQNPLFKSIVNCAFAARKGLCQRDHSLFQAREVLILLPHGINLVPCLRRPKFKPSSSRGHLVRSTTYTYSTEKSKLVSPGML